MASATWIIGTSTGTSTFKTPTRQQNKLIIMQIFNAVAIIAVLAGSTSAFSSVQQKSSSRAFTALFNGPTLGSGGMADTRDPDAMAHEDARKSISAAPSFEEYLKMRDGGAPAPA